MATTASLTADTTVIASMLVGKPPAQLDLRRNPFAFGTGRKERHRVASSPRPAEPPSAAVSTSTADDWPTLIGIAQERDGTRTAILVDAKGELMFALAGSVLGGYRVRRIDAEAIELEAAATGQLRWGRVR